MVNSQSNERTAIIVVPSIGAIPIERTRSMAEMLCKRLKTVAVDATAYVVVNYAAAEIVEERSSESVTFLLQTENLGFGRSVHVAVDYHREQFGAASDMVFVVNDDLVFDPNFDPRGLTTDLESGRPIAYSMGSGTRSAQPSTSLWSVFLKLSMLSRFGWLVGLSSRVHRSGETRHEPIPGFALVRIPSSTWQLLGGFDLRFQHYYEDQDFAIRSANSGNPVRNSRLDGVEHLRGASRSLAAADILAVEIQAAVRFLRKWGHGLPASVLTVGLALMSRMAVRACAGKFREASQEAISLVRLARLRGRPKLPFLDEPTGHAQTQWPPHLTVKQETCLACGSSLAISPEFGPLTDWLFGAAGFWNLWRCLSCESLVLNPRPSADSLHLAYSRYYTHAGSEQVANKSRLRESVKNLEFRIAQICAGTPGHGRSWLVPRTLSRSAVLTAAVKARWRMVPVSPGQSRTVLDVGCGDGRFMERAERLGWTAFGVDQDPEAISAASDRGLRVVQGTIESSGVASESLDLITLGHVIEHVDSPRQLLEDSFGLLRSGGAIWIQTPNSLAPGLERHGHWWRGLEPPRHLCIHSRSALVEMLEAAGFTVVERRVWQPVAWSVYMQSIPSDVAGTSSRYRRLAECCAGMRADLKAYAGTAEDEFLTLIARK